MIVPIAYPPAIQNGRPAILNVGQDSRLRETREMILEREGYDTASVRAEDVHRVRFTNIRVAILCHTLTEEVRESMIAFLREHAPHVRILALEKPHRLINVTWPGLFVSSPDPQSILKTVRTVLG